MGRKLKPAQVEVKPPSARAARDETTARMMKDRIAADAGMRCYWLDFIHSTEVSRVATITHVGHQASIMILSNKVSEPSYGLTAVYFSDKSRRDEPRVVFIIRSSDELTDTRR